MDGVATDADEALATPFEHRDVEDHPPVHGDDHLELATTNRCLKGFAEVRVGMDVLDSAQHGMVGFVLATVEHRDVKAAIDQLLDDLGTARSGATDHEYAHVGVDQEILLGRLPIAAS
ncbi:MAG TPA: hypothetical protein VF183_01520 [Acidimicrobiales bacterium]